jgi:1-acyl-sn-glycerol-3-phosphate acyltransferase
VIPPLWGRLLGQLLFGLVWPVRVHGAELLPSDGPVLLASNHLGFLDGPMLFSKTGRHPRCLVKREMFASPLGFVLRAMRQIPVDRAGVDRVAMQTALDALAGGDVVAVFPEGTRGRGDAGSVKHGIAWLALRSGAPVVPVACLGTRRTGEGPNRLPWPGRRLDLVFGGPLRPAAADAESGRDALRRVAAAVQAAMAAHVADAVRRTGQALPDDTTVGTE